MPTVITGVSPTSGLRFSHLLNRFSIRVKEDNVLILVSHAIDLSGLAMKFANEVECSKTFDLFSKLLQYDPAIIIDLKYLRDDPIEYIKKINEQLNPVHKEKPISFTIDDLLQ